MHDVSCKIPRILISSLRGGSGKTIVSVGIISAIARLGKKIAPFKKGPDYIDAGWLALAAGRPCFNLDTFMAHESDVFQSFLDHSSKDDIDLAVIEGNRGLFDGVDVDGLTSSASLARLLRTPVILCLDCTKATRTLAAQVLGCLNFDPYIIIKGVILNYVGGVRQENLIRKCIDRYCGVQVIGAVPRLGTCLFPERHMGLVPTPEHPWAAEAIHATAEAMEKYADIQAVWGIAQSSSKWPVEFVDSISEKSQTHPVPISCASANLHKNKTKIGVFKDLAFQFYYPDNLEALQSAGADLVFISPLNDTSLPEINALYIGGGFPEIYAEPLSKNLQFKNQIRAAVELGLPVYAECGGLMYLGESLVLDRDYPMAGVLPVTFGFSEKPQGHGYTIAEVDNENPYFEKGMVLKGHEFHYSKVIEWKGDTCALAFQMRKGNGICNQRDGICYKNVLATYMHIHALGVKEWAGVFAGKARSYAERK